MHTGDGSFLCLMHTGFVKPKSINQPNLEFKVNRNLPQGNQLDLFYLVSPITLQGKREMGEQIGSHSRCLILKKMVDKYVALLILLKSSKTLP